MEKQKIPKCQAYEKKIHEHKNSDGHIKATDILQQSEKKHIEKVLRSYTMQNF